MLTASLIIALIVLFIHSTTWEGHIFESIKDIIKPEWKISKPIYGCPICMTPWWGSIIYWLCIGISIPHWLLTVGAAAGFSVLFVVMIDLKDAAIAYKKEAED